MNSFVIKADFCHSVNKDEIKTSKDSYLVCIDGISKGIFKVLPEEYKNLKFYDYSDKLVLPGLVDLHLHAPQYEFTALGMDLELLEWLNKYTFPNEFKYADLEYAKKMYTDFSNALLKSPTTRACIFSTIHLKTTILLMDLLDKTGLVCQVGKVNMDRNSEILNEDTQKSIADTKIFIEETIKKYKNIKPILTPRFIPSCSDELMAEIGKMQRDYSISLQSHLSENKSEIKWVRELEDVDYYAQAYDKFGTFGTNGKTIMAHCVWSDEKEQELLKKRGVYIAHCPNSNSNLASGIAPVKKYLNESQKIGLGTDVAAGFSISIFRQMSDAIQVSKLRHTLVDNSLGAVSLEEAFYMATLGGGEFFGSVGSFEAGFECDLIVIDDRIYRADYNLRQRLERVVYLSKDDDIVHKFVRGEKLF